MKLFRKWFSLFLGVLLLTACEEEENCCEDIVDQPTVNHYVAVEVGDEKVYRIDSIKYDDFSGTVDTLTHWRRELTVETFRDLENRLNYRQEIYVREDSLAKWRMLKVRSVFVDKSVFELKEDNVVKINLRYPIKVGRAWDANLMNTLGEQNYSYQSLNVKEDLGWEQFTNLLVVKQIDEENLIEKQFAEEKYSPNYGLISRRDLNISTSFDGEILSGYDCRWRLVEN